MPAFSPSSSPLSSASAGDSHQATDAGPAHKPRRVCTVSVSASAGSAQWRSDTVATEYPLTLVVNDREMATLVCTPSDLRDLVWGFLTAEGVLRPGERVTRLFVDVESGTAFVDAPDREGAWEQEMFAKRYVGSCCGKSRTGFYFANDARTAQIVDGAWTLSVERCFALMHDLQSTSPLFDQTGGVHNAGLATPGGLEATRTDIGRHNTLDKLYGYALRTGLDLTKRLVVFSGRISSEIVLKVSKMGCPVLVSQCAPTALALDMADDLGITTVGFLRGDRCNVYTHPHRLTGLPTDPKSAPSD